jgi:hypothetical protein
MDAQSLTNTPTDGPISDGWAEDKDRAIWHEVLVDMIRLQRATLWRSHALEWPSVWFDQKCFLSDDHSRCIVYRMNFPFRCLWQSVNSRSNGGRPLQWLSTCECMVRGSQRKFTIGSLARVMSWCHRSLCRGRSYRFLMVGARKISANYLNECQTAEESLQPVQILPCRINYETWKIAVRIGD